MKHIPYVAFVTTFVVILAGCSVSTRTAVEAPVSPITPVSAVVVETDDTMMSNPAEGSPSMELTEDYTGAISIRNQLALGTLRLEGTPQAVSKEQAVNLVMMWNLLRALQADSTAAQQELEAAQAGLIANMEPAQIATIAAMHLTTDDLNAFYTEKGLTLSTPEPGVTPQGGGGGGMSPAERESRRATAAALGTPTGGGQGQGQGSQRQTVLLDTVVELLNQRLAE